MKTAFILFVLITEKECEELKEYLNLRDAAANERIHKHIKKFQVNS